MARSSNGKPSFFTRLRNNRFIQGALRLLQFLSSVISLGFFCARLYRVMQVARRASRSDGAVAGILAASVLYTLSVMLMKFCLKGGGPKILRWILIVLDVLFIGAFIAVAVLTRPNGGPSGPCQNTSENDSRLPNVQNVIPNNQNCNLPWATFILAIISTFLHLLTALFHEAKDHHRKNKAQKEMEKGQYGQDGQHGQNGHNGHDGYNGQNGQNGQNAQYAPNGRSGGY